MIDVRPVAHGSKEYEATVELRREVLRRPLGLDFTPEGLAAERDDTHLALFEGETVVACLVLTPENPTTLKMRQVAVRPGRQGQGLGRRLVDAAEPLSSVKGYRRMVLHARDAAVPFYLAQGYAVEGDPFEEVGIPHRAMSKEL